MRQLTDRILNLLETTVEPGLQLWEEDMRNVPLIEAGEWQREFRPKLFQAHLGAASLGKHIIARLPNRGQVIHQGARPIEYDVPNHAAQCRGAGASDDNFFTILLPAHDNPQQLNGTLST